MTEITRYEIDMIDVKAADAFLIHAYVKFNGTDEYEYVVLVDAGNEGDGAKIINHINTYYNQKYIDLVIITHCDNDHYGGMQYLIKQHNNPYSTFRINNIWIHDPFQHVNIDDVKYIRNNKTLRERLNAAYKFSDDTNLIEIIDKANIKREEPFNGLEYTPLNIKVLGPDKAFYESLIPDFRVDLDFKDGQIDDEYKGMVTFTQSEDEFYSKTLESSSDDSSKVNQSSVIFKMNVKGKTLLFTGDAGKEAIHRIIDYDWLGNLKDVYFLKVPHHGSKHNLDNAIISYLHPKVAYISTENYGKYANRCTINALKKVGKVFSTHKDRSSLWLHEGTTDRNDYSNAIPL